MQIELDIPPRLRGDDEVPRWMKEVLCDLQRAAHSQGLSDFARDIGRLRELHSADAGGCEGQAAGGLSHRRLC